VIGFRQDRQIDVGGLKNPEVLSHVSLARFVPPPTPEHTMSLCHSLDHFEHLANKTVQRGLTNGACTVAVCAGVFCAS